MSAPMDKVLAALRAAGKSVRPSGTGWACQCPSHDDQQPSLSLGIGKNGAVVLHCHTGCPHETVLAALGLRFSDLWPSPETAGGPSRPSQAPWCEATPGGAVNRVASPFGRKPDRVWPYHDSTGRCIGLVLRWDLPGGKKDIRVLSRSGDGWQPVGMPKPHPLYRLHRLERLPAGARVFVTEGEKAADAAIQCGLVATTSPHGSSNAHKADWSAMAGKEVVILPDNDEPGRKYAEMVADLCHRAGCDRVCILPLPDLPPSGDIADLLEAHAGDSSELGTQIQRLADAALADQTTPAAPSPSIPRSLVMVRLSDVQPEQVSWLWQDRIPLGKVTILTGDPGLGKSFITMDLAARVSCGRPMPLDQESDHLPGGVIILTAEDDLADTIRPRLDAAGADTSRIMAIQAVRNRDLGSSKDQERMFDLSRDIPRLEEAIEVIGDCRMIVIDPITAYLGRTDANQNAEVRSVLSPLAQLAAKHNVAIVGVSHLNKGSGRAITRNLGSIGFVAAARSALMVVKDKDDPEHRLVLPAKNNLGRDNAGIGYRIAPSTMGPTPVVVWDDVPIFMSADEYQGHEESSRTPERREHPPTAWLRDYLADGPLPQTQILQAAQDAGFTKHQMDSAKRKLGVQPRKTSTQWVWSLPDQHVSTQHSAAS